MNNSPAPAPSIQEYSIRVPKNVRKKFHVMRFNSAVNTDFTKWTQVKMERENNSKEYQRQDDEQPKFGAGSEYGREAREEARRKKFGIVARKYKPEDQPWILKINGKTGKKFKGIREGGVAENASYYVFTHAANGGIEAYPLCEWYNFQAIQRYKALSAEEAELEFGRRNKVMNYFSLMLRKRLKNEDDGEGEEAEEGKSKKGKKSSDFKISEMDDWIDSDEDSSGEENEKDEDGGKKEKKNKADKGKKPKKKKAKGSDESAVEESDDGDEEGRELDYISDSSESESDKESAAVKDLKGVAEETALRKLLTSDEDDEEEAEKKDEASKDDKKESDKTDAKESAKEKDAKKRKRKKKVAEKKKAAEGSSSDSSDSSDSEVEKTNKESGSNSASGSRSATPTEKSKKGEGTPAKKPRMDVQTPMLSYGGDSGITEEAVRRYLMRKPMTATELIQKFKGRKTGLSSDQMVNVMTQILKKINPVKQTIKSKMYLSIKPQ